MMRKSNYPIGSTWVLNKNGKKYRIWLSEIRQAFDVWRFSWCYSDGSGGESDWTTSYRSARKALLVDGRFKKLTQPQTKTKQ